MKRMVMAIVAVALAAGGAPAQSADKPEDVSAVILRELRELRAEVAALKAELAALKTELAAIKEALEEKGPSSAVADPPPISPTDVRSRGPNTGKLAKIKLAENPTENQVREYIAAIVSATGNQNSFNSSDPQIAMLAAVGSKHVPLLLEAMGDRRQMGNFHMKTSLQQLVRQEHKALVLKAMQTHRDLVEIVVQMGWEDDAKKTLVDALVAGPDYLPTDWIQAVAGFSDPATYDALKEYLISGGNRSRTYKAIRNLPAIDLTDAVAKAWKRARLSHEYEATDMAMVAVQYGHVDALEYLIDTLTSPRTDEYRQREARAAVLRYVSVGGSDQELADWFKRNKDQLVFDPEEKIFVVGEKQAP